MRKILFTTILTTVSFFSILHAQDSQYNVYVAMNGNDANPGTLTEPFATIQHAVSVMTPGDTCYIRGGTYREEVDLSGVAGESGAPITLTNYQDEEVILSGTLPITSNWTQHSGNIYKTTLSEDIWQLFVDGKHMTLARFPNALAFSDLMWLGGLGATSYKVYFGSDPQNLAYQGSQTNNIFDPGSLKANTMYYWSIDSLGPDGTVKGNVWTVDTSKQAERTE